MLNLSPIALGIALLIIGLAFILLIFLLLRILPKLHIPAKSTTPAPSLPDLTQHNEGVLLVQHGGRVTYLNQRARELFNLWGEEPNIESLARRTRPSSKFLSLCAREGQARFSLNGRFVEGASYFAKGNSGATLEQQNLILITLRRPQLVLDNNLASENVELENSTQQPITSPPQSGVSSQAFAIFTELSQAMTSSLALETTLQSILESVERLLPSDFFEITIWEEENKHLIPYRLVGFAEVDRRLEKVPDRYQPTEGFTGHLVKTKKPLLIPNVNTYRDVRPVLDRQKYPFRSYLGVPLVLASKLIGTLELASLSENSYNENDLYVLRLLGDQASIALNNALLYQQEQQRAIELAGLSNLAQAISALRDSQDLFNRLIDGISPLIHVEILGFLIYDENRRVLEGKIPFVGIPNNIIEWYQGRLEPGSEGERIFESMESIIVLDQAPEDPRLQAFKLDDLAQIASIHQTLLVPLTSGGRIFGYILAANKRDGAIFDQNDVRILSIIAGQAAPIIENATLVDLSRRRAQRAETLRRVASLTSSAATLDEILKFSILDLSRLLQADLAAIFLLDESRGELRLHKISTFGIAPELSDRLGRISIDDPNFQDTITASKQLFITQDLNEETGIPSIYTPLIKELDARSAIVAPLISRERGIGEIMIGSLKPGFFTSGDLQTLATSSGQLAAAIEQSALYSQTDQSLRQRVDQLTALTRISRELNTTLDQERLLQRVYDEALLTTQSDCGTILIFDLSGNKALGRSDDALEIALYLGDKPENGLGPLDRKVLETGDPIVVDDFSAQQVAADHDPTVETARTLSPPHEGIRSAMVIPIAYQGQIAGLIQLHAKSAHHFGNSEREIGEALAIQAAIALGNSQRFREQLQRSELLNRRIETLSRLFEISQVIQSEQPLEESLESIAYAIQAATPFDIVLISIYHPNEDHLERITGAGIPLASLAELKAHKQPWAPVQALFHQDFSLGRTYFIPKEQRPLIPQDVHLLTLMPDNQQHDDESAWQPEDMLLVPLYDAAGAPLGLVSVDAPRNNLRPDRPAIESLEIFSVQASLVIESQQKLHNLRGRLKAIEEELAVAQASASEAQKHLPTLLQKDLKQTLVIQNLSQRAQRINAGLEIAGIISRQASREDVLSVLGIETLARMEFDVALVGEQRGGEINLTNTFGLFPTGVNPKALIGQKNPLRDCLRDPRMILIADLEESDAWQNTPLLRALEAKSFVCIPLGEQQDIDRVDTALLAISKNTQATFSDDDEQLFSLLARQAAVALQNLRLIDETKHRLREVNLLLDFSRQLGSLDQRSILQTLVESALSAIPSAQAAMISLWDEKQNLLVPQAASGYADNLALLEVTYGPGEGLPGQIFEEKRAVRLDEVDFARHYNLAPNNLLRYRNATGGHIPVSSIAVPIMAGTGRENGRDKQSDSQIDSPRTLPLGVVILDNTQAAGAFSDDDLAVIISLAQQTALTLENARLYQASEQRSQQLRSLTEVATTITSSLQPEDLIATLLDQLQEILPYDTGILWLRHENMRAPSTARNRMVVRAARGFEDSDQRVGLTVDVQDSALLSEMIQTSQPLWVSDITKDPRFRTLAMDFDFEMEGSSPALGFERLSWLGVPLIASGEVIGVIALEKSEANYYSPDDLQVATAFAGQAAIGLENAKLYQDSVLRAQELDQRTQTLTTLNRLSSALSGSLNARHILSIAAKELYELLNCSSVSALWFRYLTSDRQGQEKTWEVILQTEYPDADSMATYLPGELIPNSPLFERLAESLGIFNTDDVTQEPELASLQEYLSERNTQALLVVPIASGSTTENESGQQYVHGMLLAHQDQPYRFEADELELARTISNQIAISLQNARLFEETRSLTEELELRVQQRTAELEHEHQRSGTLLRIISELSASLDLDQVLYSTLQVLSEFVDAEHITILISRPGERKLHRLASVGYTQEPASEGEPTALSVDQGLAGWIISQRQSVMLEDVQKDERWIDLSSSQKKRPYSLKHRSAMGVPLMSGADALGALLLFHPRVGHFSLDQLDLVQAAANQVAVAVNNAELYRLIRDQAEDLGTMLRNQQVETSRSKAILEAVADGVLVTDENRRITLFNESAEKILGLERSQVLGKSLEQFIGFFGRAAQSWMETISDWSIDAAVYEIGATYAEQITLEDGRVISVHLAPVSLHSDFLGTVSIFQDITHQVEVDRLKSEFVATVSHELRTPMTSIKGYVEVLLMGAAGKLTEQQENFLQVVKTNTERLAVLVNDLLDVSQIEAGRAALSIQPLNLEELTNQSIIDLEHRARDENRPIEIIKQFSNDLPRVSGDPDRVRQILDNLLDNGYQYNLPDGKITVTIHQVGEEVQVDVKDTGVGIQFSDHEQVFERFYRGENPLVLGISGTGLGLSIVKNLVEMHGGRIWFQSLGIPGKGSTFSFTLPIYSTMRADG